MSCLAFKSRFYPYLTFVIHQMVDPPDPYCGIGGHYFHTWCPFLRTENKNTRTAKWGLVGHFEVFRLVIHLKSLCYV